MKENTEFIYWQVNEYFNYAAKEKAAIKKCKKKFVYCGPPSSSIAAAAAARRKAAEALPKQRRSSRVFAAIEALLYDPYNC